MEVMEHVLHITAILSIGVVYGVDVFFTVVGRTALNKSSDESMTEIIGRIHETADKRMPLFGAAALLSTVMLTLFQLLNSSPALTIIWSVAALILQIVFLIMYSLISKPINAQLIRAAQTSQVPANARLLQNRWDSVIPVRASLLFLTLLILTISI